MTTPAGLTGHAEHQFLAKVQDIAGYWAAFSGGEPSIGVSEQYDGGAETPDLIASRGTTSNVVLRRPFKPGRDMAVQKLLRESIKNGYMKPIWLQPVDRDGKVVGPHLQCDACLLVRVGSPTYDANSDTGSSWELEFRPSSTFIPNA